MKNIDKYIEKVKQFINNNPDLTEDLIVRYVYLDLPNYFSFDPKFIPFGNNKTRRKIYEEGFFPSKVDECFDTNQIICSSIAKIFEIVLRNLDIKVNLLKEVNDNSKRKKSCKHVYCMITPKDSNRPKYAVDLQEDLFRIQMGGSTPNYGISIYDESKYVISKFEQEQMDRRLGYITEDKYYTDTNINELKESINSIDDFNLKVKYVLEHTEVIKNPKVGYIDRQWYYASTLKKLFTKEEFDYDSSTGKIRIINCYKELDDKKILVNCITVEDNNKIHIYLYNQKEYKYQEIDFKYFLIALRNGLIIHNNRIMEVEKVLRKEKVGLR